MYSNMLDIFIIFFKFWFSGYNNMFPVMESLFSCFSLVVGNFSVKAQFSGFRNTFSGFRSLCRGVSCSFPVSDNNFPVSWIPFSVSYCSFPVEITIFLFQEYLFRFLMAVHGIFRLHKEFFDFGCLFSGLGMGGGVARWIIQHPTC